jgi:hypothetical protein
MIHLARSALSVMVVVVLGLAPACGEDGGPGGGADATTSSGLPFLASCTTGAECATGLCFNFSAKGLHCTHACQSNAGCEEPSPGCNNMNVCKVP